MKPMDSPAHEAKESPAMERMEHKTGKEAADLHKRGGKRKGARAAKRIGKR